MKVNVLPVGLVSSVVCDRGPNAHVEKGEVVRDVGGVEMILSNTAMSGEDWWRTVTLWPPWQWGETRVMRSESMRRWISNGCSQLRWDRVEGWSGAIGPFGSEDTRNTLFNIMSDSPELIVEERCPRLICLGVSARSEAGDHTDLEVRLSKKGLIITTDSWFIKIVSTLFLCSTSFDDEFLDYFLLSVHQGKVEYVSFILDLQYALRSLCQANLHSSAKLLYDSMRSDGPLPDYSLLGFLVSSFALADRFDVSKELLAEALCKSNRLQEAHNLLRLLKQSDIDPQSFVYNPVIGGYCKSGNIDETNVIVAEMEEKCKPDKLTFTILIIGHCMKGRTL
ncbi:Subtilisin-like protease [Vigna angularis]|uniref:Subtilisin-like protease n=1 Tax=Phaseolus angularis TaxID=3914 RepID=A0A8T0JL52_PHAAN|nr:Subtilisin-like protease [Vigna angularis]